ncbi:MAG: hypothetical protein M1297_09165 [Nitrospirae bacterium]|nr:hypothetical protein [Nitrospirota bacterium]
MPEKKIIFKTVLASMIGLGLTGCAETSSLMGNHLNAAQRYRASAKQAEKTANEQSVILNHLSAAHKYAQAGLTRLRSASEYGDLGNPSQASNEYHKASDDFTHASVESQKAIGAGQ